MMLERILGALPHYPEGHFASGPSFHKYYDRSFAITTDMLRRIVQSMSEGIKMEFPESPQSFEIVGTTGAGTTSFHNLDELLAYDNSSRSLLSAVSLTVRPDNHAMATHVELKNYMPGWSAAVIVEGGDENTSRGLFENLKDRLKPSFQWYSFLLNGRFWSSLLIACVIIYLVTLLGPQLYSKISAEPTAPADVQAGDGLMPNAPASSGPGHSRQFVIGVTVFSVIGVLLGFELIPRLFPKGAFLIGKGVARFRKVTLGRYVLIIVLLVPLVLSIARSLQQ